MLKRSCSLQKQFIFQLTLRLVKGYVPFPGIKGVVKKNLLKDGDIRHHVFLVALHGPTLSFLCRRFRAFKFCLKTEKNHFFNLSSLANNQKHYFSLLLRLFMTTRKWRKFKDLNVYLTVNSKFSAMFTSGGILIFLMSESSLESSLFRCQRFRFEMND